MFRIEYERRVITLCEIKLNGKHLTVLVNTYAISNQTDYFGIVKSTKTDMKKIKRKTQIIITIKNHSHPKSEIERLIITRQHGGRGLIEINHFWHKQMYKLKKFFHIKTQRRCKPNTITLNLEVLTYTDNPVNTDSQIKVKKRYYMDDTHMTYTKIRAIRLSTSEIRCRYSCYC